MLVCSRCDTPVGEGHTDDCPVKQLLEAALEVAADNQKEGPDGHEADAG